MIIYNMRYRGPYEYDKLILNVLQYHNEVMDLVHEMKEKGNDLDKLSTSIDLMSQRIEDISNQVLFYKERSLER